MLSIQTDRVGIASRKLRPDNSDFCPVDDTALSVFTEPPGFRAITLTFTTSGNLNNVAN